MIRGRIRLPFTSSPNHISRAILVGAKKRSAAVHSLRFARLTRIERRIWSARLPRDPIGVGKKLIVVGPVPVRTPFPNIASNVVQAVAVWWELRHGCYAHKTVLAGIAANQWEFALIDIRHPLSNWFEFIPPCVYF